MEQEFMVCTRCECSTAEVIVEKNTETQVESIAFYCPSGCGIFARIYLPDGFAASVEYVSEKE